MKKVFCVLLLSLSLISAPSFADWFVSSETKTLITRADAGDAEAQFKVGVAYDFGQGAPRNTAEAIKWYTMAANGGHVEAQNSLGSALQAEKNFTEARSWYEKASAQGHAHATNNLAYLYDMGLGVSQDRQKGFELYTKAADLRWAEAMWNLANMYATGQVGNPDMVMACVWSMRAQKYAGPRDQRLSAHLSRVLPQLERSMPSADFASCREKAEAWSPALVAKQEVLR